MPRLIRRDFLFLGQIPPVGNSAKIRARGRGGLQLRGERIRPPPPFSAAKRESRPRRWDFSTAKRESRPRRWDFSTAKRESQPRRWDFSTAKRESRPSHWDFSTAKRESRPSRLDFSTAKRESRPFPLGLLHGEARKPTSPLGLLRGEARKRRAAPFRRGTRGRARRRKKGFFYTRKAGLPVLRVSRTTQKLRRLLSCFLARKE